MSIKKSVMTFYSISLSTFLMSCGNPQESGSQTKQSLSARSALYSTQTGMKVNFKSRSNGFYLAAENGGGSSLNVNRTLPREWELFEIIDRNGGSLRSGDLVFLQTFNKTYLQITDGTSVRVNAASANRENWELFTVLAEKDGEIGDKSMVRFKSFSSGKFLSLSGSELRASAAQSNEAEIFELIKREPPTPNPPNSGEWKLVWSDEFNGTQIDPQKWNFEIQRPGWVNNELQNYTNRRENARVEGGNLVIEGRRDYFNGHEYSSARLKTAGKASWKYGRFEARIMLPTGYGTWPAFWMMPDDFSQGWPACGEIDIMEHVGYDPDVIHATTHSKAYNWKSSQQRTATTRTPGATSGFHIYAMEWYEDRIEMYVDGVKYYTSRNDRTGTDAWPFQKNFHIILNLAIGGAWGGVKGVDPNIWPKRMLVDYVRVYQK